MKLLNAISDLGSVFGACEPVLNGRILVISPKSFPETAVGSEFRFRIKVLGHSPMIESIILQGPAARTRYRTAPFLTEHGQFLAHLLGKLYEPPSLPRLRCRELRDSSFAVEDSASFSHTMPVAFLSDRTHEGIAPFISRGKLRTAAVGQFF
jgi:hypothetical protein